MGRRRQHSGGLALASDQFPGWPKTTFVQALSLSAPVLPGLSQSGNAMLPQTDEKRQVWG